MKKEKKAGLVWELVGKVTLVIIVLGGLIGFVVVPKVSAATGCFPDTGGHWAETFICWMSDTGLTGGYPDGTYKPENNVTRAEMAVFMKNSYDLVSGEDDDTLGSLSCATNQIAKWTGSVWECQADLSGSGSDTLGSLSCSTDEIAKWNGSAWTCQADEEGTGADTLASLSCSTDEVARWTGTVWACCDLDTDYYTKTEVDGLISALGSRITALEATLASVSLENGGDDFVFTNVNVHVRDGSGNTDGSVNGRGNLIVGYNEDVGSDATRTGSHNLVVGSEHSYSNFGGFVAGYSNTISSGYASVSGGRVNTASGYSSSVSGGSWNIASGDYSSISGGDQNTASGLRSSVSGGRYNSASGSYTSVIGGGGDAVAEGNDAWANYSVVAGGRSNTAGSDGGTDRTVGEASAVLAGRENRTTGDYASVSGGRDNEASGDYSSVSGGIDSAAIGDYASVSGGLNNYANGFISSVSGGSLNVASGDNSSISGGYENTASGSRSSVSGGELNTASGTSSSVSGGLSRAVSGAHDWRAGAFFQTQ